VRLHASFAERIVAKGGPWPQAPLALPDEDALPDESFRAFQGAVAPTSANESAPGHSRQGLAPIKKGKSSPSRHLSSSALL